jgi:ketosteroid isomerase-like protein
MNAFEKMLRDAYAVFAQGDLEGYLSYCTPDFTFTVPGTNRVSGVYSREDFGPKLIGTVMAVSNGTFTETVLDVFTSDRGGIVYARHVFDNGGPQEYKTLHLYEIRDGKLANAREVPLDMGAFDRAWS